MSSTILTPWPEEEGLQQPTTLDPSNPSTIDDRPRQLVGQSVAYRKLRGALVRGDRKRKRGSPICPITVLGPFGCGKSVAVRAACHELGHPLVEIDLSEQSDFALAYEIASKLNFSHGVALVDNLHKSTPGRLQSLAEALAAKSVALVVDRRRVDFELSQVQIVLSVSGYAQLPSEPGKFVGDWLLPVEIQTNLGTVIEFRSLSRPEMFEILAMPGSPHCRALLAELGSEQEEVEISELALYEFIDQARERFPVGNMRGLEVVLEEFVRKSYDSMELESEVSRETN
ncbi:MAG TPA: AAA family ATPase [Fimbriimonadaceae bacterium]|nr:AAA family ATPase [Fimbriimonadaceae bacterium]